jgi:hypothetical protein
VSAGQADQSRGSGPEGRLRYAKDWPGPHAGVLIVNVAMLVRTSTPGGSGPLPVSVAVFVNV